MATDQRSNLAFAGGAKITGLPASSAAGEPVVHEQLLAAVEGNAWKDNARVSTVGNLNLSSPGATVDGIAMAVNDRVLVRSQTAQTENGIYLWNGAAVAMTRALDASTFDELESAVVGVDEGTSAGATFRQTAVNGVLGTNNVVWASFGTAAPAASETTPGIAELATQAETDTGTDDLRIVTPLKLASWSGRKRKTVPTAFGDGSATQYDFTHNFSTRDVLVQVYRNATPWDNINCDVSRPDVNTVRLNFVQAPTSNQFSIVVIS
jgi:hypothetical protein